MKDQKPKDQRHNKSSKKWLVTVFTLILLAGIGVGAYFGAKAIYESGLKQGHEEESKALSESITSLGHTVAEKADFLKSLAESFASLPSELDTEGIDKYLASLTELINKTTNENVKNTLNEYLAKWQDFKSTYESQDNNKITESFNALKTSAEETSAKIKSIYDDLIISAVNNL